MLKSIAPTGARSVSNAKTQLLACCGTVALITACALSAPAFAQGAAAAAPGAAAPGEDTATVVVTGIRKGIQDAITAKKKSSQIVEAVSAEDIGKLPDASIAESIARLPGIAAQRTNGRAQTLSIRGLGPDYTVTTLNGREQTTVNDNRSVEFDQYPSELISQVLVYKTPNSSMATQGIAGTADLQTVRPLSYGKRAIAFNVRGESNSEKAAIAGMKNTGNRYSLTYINQFANKTIGLALGYAHTDSPYQVLKKEPWGDGNFPTCSGASNGAAVCGTNGGKYILGGEKDGILSSNLKRDGYMGVLEFRPNDKLHMTFDAYHSDFTELQKIARLEFPLTWSGATLQPGFTTNSDFVTHEVFTGVKAVVENYTNVRKAKVDALGWNTEYALNNQWALMADVSYSKVDRTDIILETTAGTGSAGTGALDTVTVDQPQSYGLATLKNTLNYGDFNTVYLTDPGGWGGPVNRAGYVKTPHITDELNSIKLAAKRTLSGGIFSNVSVGLQMTDRKKGKMGLEGYISLKTGPQALVPTAYRLGVTDAAFLGGPSGMISYDGLGLYNSGFYTFTEETGSDAIKKKWNIEEKVNVAYVKADIDSTLFGVPVTGNVGLQAQSADQKSSSYFTDGTATGLTLKADGAKYTDVLPSLNLNFALADDTTLRLGAGTTIARPRLDDLSGGTSFSTSVDGNVPTVYNGKAVYWSGSGGNPKLKPWKANAFDLSVEKYFGRKGYVSVAMFYKDLTSYIFAQTVVKDFTGVALPAYCTSSTPPPSHSVCTTANANRTGIVTAPANGSGGSIKGVEFTASLPGDLFLPQLDGFGVILSGAFNNSAINPMGTGNIDLPGLSKKVINTTVYYEKHGLSARISNRYRDDFLGEVPDYTNSLQYRMVHSESIVDAQLGYAFGDGPLKGVSLSVSGTNLTNEPFILYAPGNKANIMRKENYGSTYLFGINYKY